MNLIVEQFLTIQQQLRLFHWTTKIYNHHIVSGELYEKLDKIVDQFIETMLGKYELSINTVTIKTKQVDQKGLLVVMNQFKHYLLNDIDKLLEQMDNNDLKNIRDEMVGDVNQFIFLIRLK